MTQDNQPDLKETIDHTSNSDVLLMAIVRFSQVLPINIVLFVLGTIISGLLIDDEIIFPREEVKALYPGLLKGQQCKQPRTPGLLKGQLGDAFFEPLPEEELQQWG